MGFVPVDVSEEDALAGRYAHNYDIQIGDNRYVSYEKIYNGRFAILRQAYENFKQVYVDSKSTLAKGLPIYKQFDNFLLVTIKNGLMIMLYLWLLSIIIIKFHGQNGTMILSFVHIRRD